MKNLILILGLALLSIGANAQSINTDTRGVFVNFETKDTLTLDLKGKNIAIQLNDYLELTTISHIKFDVREGENVSIVGFVFKGYMLEIILIEGQPDRVLMEGGTAYDEFGDPFTFLDNFEKIN